MRYYLFSKHDFCRGKNLFLFILFTLLSFSGKAQNLLSDNFDYTVGNLAGQGEWKQWRTSSTNPLQVTDTTLTYTGYQDKAIGKAVKTGENGQGVNRLFTPVSSGSLYYSALVCIKKTMNTTGDYFLCFGDGNDGASLYGRLYAKTTAGGKLQFGASRSSSAVYYQTDYEFDQTYLIVVKYTIMPGEKDDEVSLFINPVIGDTEPTPLLIRNNETTYDPSFSFASMNIRQPTSKGGAAIGVIDAVRVSTTWKGLFEVSDEQSPVLTITPKSLSFGSVFEGDIYHKVINIKGKNLKGDITVAGMTTGEVTVSATTISKAVAESEPGFDLTVTLTPVLEDNYKDDLIFTSEGMTDVKITPKWATTAFTDVPDLKTLRANDPTDEWTKYRITGEAVISHIFKDGTKTTYYLQDAERGITVYDGFGDITTVYNVGDKVKNFCGSLSSVLGSISFIPVKDFGAAVSTGNEITPVELTLTELKAKPGEYESRLIKTDVEFKGVASAPEPPVFAEGVSPDITDGTTDSKMRVFKGADIVGTPIPVKATLIGVSTAGNGNIVAPRNLKDIILPVVDDGNMFENSGFEEWTGNDMFGYNPKDWESIMGTTFQESSIKLSGDYALRIKASSKESSLKQDIRPDADKAFLPGQKYELTLNYYTVTSQGGNDITLKSYWRSGGTTELTHDQEVLNNGTFFTSVGKWESKTIQTTVAEGASSFYFVLNVPKGVEVVLDNFSFKKVPSTEPMLTVLPDKVNKLNTNINTPVTSQKIMIYTDNLPAATTLEMTGTNAAYFTPSVTTIPVNQHATELTIAYNPTTAGDHSAMLTIECPGMAALTKTISLKGYAVDPANPSLITVDQAGPVAMTAEVGKSSEHTVLVTSKNLTDYLYVRVMGDDGKGQFIISNTILEKNKENVPLTITFRPKQEGSFNERIAVYCKTDTVFVAFTATATKGTTEEPEGDKFPLDVTNPRVLLNEHFDAITHNKVLKLDGWKNIAKQNTRAWWGYDFENENVEVVEGAAKASAYSSTVTQSLPHEMWLVTPPLDFKNAASKIFTFRVMGDIMLEGQDASLEVCYMDMEDGELYTEPFEIKMPSIPDENKEWREYHVDFTGQDFADVFFIGFHFKGMGGKANSAIYYIDDVSFGRTDLPMITPSKTTLEMKTYAGTAITSDPIQIQTKNLSSPVELTVGGPNASKFNASVATLPAGGGSFTVSFQSDLVGVHQAYVRVASRGAADIYIPISVNNQDESAIENIVLDQETDVTVFDFTGRELLRKVVHGSMEQLTKELDNGMYILKTNKGTFKVRVNK